MEGGFTYQRPYFTDFAAEAGADILRYLEADSISDLSGGVAVLDYDGDGDGDQDIYLIDNDEAVLLSNDGNGETFTQIGAAFIINTRDISNQSPLTWGTVLFDYANDGDEDLYIASGYLGEKSVNQQKDEPNILLRNEGNGTFSNVSSVSGAADWGNAQRVGYGDFNNDGCLDLYVGNAVRSSSTGEQAKLFKNSCKWGNN